MAQETLPIIDAHHHFWELGHGRYPWLENETIPVPLRQLHGDQALLFG